jgi:amino acid adenylation domain-containing protein
LQTTIQSRLNQQFKAYQDNTAIEYKQNTISYLQLDQKSDLIAKQILEKEIEKSTFIAILMEDKAELIATMIGILKAGCAFMPLDSSLPVQRIELMLKITDVKYIFIDESNFQKLTSQFVNKGGKVEPLRVIQAVNEPHFERNLKPREYSPEDQIYIYFTSGTTGEPKAIVGKNRSLVHFINWETKTFNINENFRISQISSIGFDASLRDIFVPLCVGGTVCIPENRDKVLDSNNLVNWIESRKINLIHCTPSIFRQINTGFLNEQNFYHLKYILLAGEKINPKELTNWYAIFGERIQLVNLYGATETTMIKTFYLISHQDTKKAKIPVGKPIVGARIIILDKYLLPCKYGDVGEVFIRTPYRTYGYYNNPKLNREKFIVNPFSNDPDDIIYRTGDLGRLSPDGNLELLGRVDRQVKIRGIRIELNEIENALLNQERIKEAVVVKRESSSEEEYLCAYWVENNKEDKSATKELSVSDLQEYLMGILPGYMVPRYFIKLPKMPVTPNGKLNYQALPEPDEANAIEYEAPRNDVEAKLADLWQEVLEHRKMGINDNFFELGGHSLKATIVVSRIFKMLNVEVPLREIFKNPTIKELAAYIQATEHGQYIAISPVEKREYYPVSSAQKRLYIIDKLEGAETSYNIPGVLVIEGEMDRGRLKTAFQGLVNRHEAFRTSFEMNAGEPVQRIYDQVELKLGYREANGLEIETIVSEFIRPFDLSQAPLLRVELIKLTESKHILLYDMHHIISDGTSTGILTREFVRLYQGEKLPELRIQYKDFAVWQNELFKKGKLQKQEEYWLNTFRGEIPVLNLPTDYSRPAVQSFKGASIAFELGEELTCKLNQLMQETGSTLYMVLLAAYNVLLAKYSGQEEIIVGSPIAGRHHADQEKIIGMFVNTLAMRNYPVGDKTFREFLGEVNENALKAYENQDYQFEELVEKLKVRRDLSRNPLFDMMFVMQNIESRNEAIAGLRIRPYPYDTMVAKFDLTLTAAGNGQGISLVLEYCTKLFKAETIERMAVHFRDLIQRIVQDPEAKLAELEMLTAAEKHRILYEFNATKADYPKDRTIQELFEEQVAKTSDNIALVYEDKEMTYEELNQKANQLARLLREKGVGPDCIVGIMVERSQEMVVGILGILKAGGAYLPIDPNNPKERIKYILEDSRTKIILTQSKWIEKIKFNGNVINLEDKAIYQGESFNLSRLTSPHNLAYVIYTSGSTGNPKGVMIEHYSLVNRLHWMQKSYALTEKDVILQKTPYTFDVSVWEIFWWALYGAKVCLLTPGGEKDPETIVRAIKQNKVTTLHFVPSMLNIFLEHIENQTNIEDLSSLRQVFASGEALSPVQTNRFNRILNNTYGIKLHNLYGPTEATVDVSYFNCSCDGELEIVPIGKPIDNISLYIVDQGMKLQPIGVAGELCIGGDGLARGYLNRPELTGDRFVCNPFIAGGRMYRTGDLARWLPDGNIEYLGRIDHQVKIRGFRIELGEIENRLVKHEAIKEAVVIAKEDGNGAKYLCAYLVAGRELTVKELREYLGQELPEYMVPSYFVQLDRLPLTPNGKIDRKALPQPEGNIQTGVEYVAPSNATEEKLAKIWREVLGLEKIGINDSFFDIGGNSLKIVKLKAEIDKICSNIITISDLFSFSTISKLAVHMNDKLNINYSDNNIEKSKVNKNKELNDILNEFEKGMISLEEAVSLFNEEE